MPPRRRSTSKGRENTRFSLPLPYLQQVADQVRAGGVDVGVWLMHAGLTPDALEDAVRDLPFETFEKLVADAMTLTREPALGLLVGQRMRLQIHGVLGYAAASSGSIRQALGLFQAFTRTRFPLVDLRVEEERLHVRVRMVESRSLGAVQRPVLETIMMATKNILDAISMGTCRIDRVSFPFREPPYAALAGELFGCRVRYGAPAASFTIPLDQLDAPLRAADPLAFTEAVRICERELERVAVTETLAGRVRRLFLEQQSGFPSLEVTARLLHVGPRTLHRRLVDEGTSFREVLEDVRHRLAIEHLKVERFTLEEIAYTLGYTDFSNFRRAFKRWEGVPPTVYRQRLARRAPS